MQGETEQTKPKFVATFGFYYFAPFLQVAINIRKRMAKRGNRGTGDRWAQKVANPKTNISHTSETVHSVREQEKKQKYRDYQREYHSNYRLQQRLEDGLIEKKPMRKLKKRIGEFVEKELQQKTTLFLSQHKLMMVSPYATMARYSTGDNYHWKYPLHQQFTNIKV